MGVLHAAGLNGHGQLTHASASLAPHDRLQFESIASGSSIEVLCATWSCTIVRQEEVIRIIGLCNGSACRDVTIPLDFTVRAAFVSDTPAYIGLVSADGKLYFVQHDAEDAQPYLELQGDDDSPMLASVAVTATGHTCISFIQQPASRLIHLLQFDAFSAFLTWFRDPSSSERDRDYTHRSIHGRVAQLQAGAAHFVLRTEEGEVYTWTTDSRQHQCLGRTAGVEAPATTPAPVEALGGIVIAKVTAGDWMTLALSKDRDAYVWGREKPQEVQRAMEVLRTAGEVVNLVDVADGADVIDVAAGSSHLLVLTTTGEVFGVGDNENGQLGLAVRGKERNMHTSAWTRLNIGTAEKAERIWAGHSTSFAMTRTS